MDQQGNYINQFNYAPCVVMNPYDMYNYHQMPMPDYYPTVSSINNIQNQMPNRFIYVNQEVANIQMHSQQGIRQQQTSTKVLINPNFKPPKVHINPNFNKPAVPTTNSTIHVNPSMLRYSISNQISMTARPLPKENETYENENYTSRKENAPLIKIQNQTIYDNKIIKKPLVSTRTKLIREVTRSANVVSSSSKIINTNLNSSNMSSVQSKYKVVNVSTHKEAASTIKATAFKKELPCFQLNPLSESRKRKTSFHSTYKIIRRSTSKEENMNEGVKKLLLKSKFKLVRKSVTKKSPKTKLITTSRFKLVNKTTSAKKVLIKYSSPSSKLFRINGVLFKKSTHNPANHASVKSSVNRSVKTILIRGQSYKMGKNKRTLKKISENRGKYASKTKYTNASLSKADISKHLLLLHSTRSKELLIYPNKLKKCNVPCPNYRRFGKCSGTDSGKCIRKHNPDQIALCTKFLQGACVNEKCLLSHNVSPEKMPTCKFFLEGLCSKPNCPYLHVKINARADICKDFLEGYCEKATECNKRHQFLCPDYEKNKICFKKRCPYPHGLRVRNANISDVAKKFKVRNTTSVKKNMKIKPRTKFSKKLDDFKDDVDKPAARYYADLPLIPDAQNLAHENVNDSDSSENESINESNTIKKRPKLGPLPSFIPFDKDQCS